MTKKHWIIISRFYATTWKLNDMITVIAEYFKYLFGVYPLVEQIDRDITILLIKGKPVLCLLNEIANNKMLISIFVNRNHLNKIYFSAIYNFLKILSVVKAR